MMKSGITFFIVIVAYNAGDKLQKTVDSVLAQTYPHYYVRVQDGASDDGSFEALRRRVGEDGRFFLHSEEDDSLYDAMNRAVAVLPPVTKVTNAYVLFMNCGDYFYDNDVLKKAASRIRQVNARYAARAQVAPAVMRPGVFYGDALDRKTGQVVSASPKMDDFACYRHIPCHQSILYELSLLKEEPFDMAYRVRADYEHFLRLKYKRKAEPVYLRMTIADYEGGGMSETPEGRADSERERKAIIEKYLPAGKVRCYDLYRTLSLQKVRMALADNPKTAPVYQRIKKLLYRGGDH